ncbi:hypothetical protein [Mycoplasma sp. Z244C]
MKIKKWLIPILPMITTVPLVTMSAKLDNSNLDEEKNKNVEFINQFETLPYEDFKSLITLLHQVDNENYNTLFDLVNKATTFEELKSNVGEKELVKNNFKNKYYFSIPSSKDANIEKIINEIKILEIKYILSNPDIQFLPFREFYFQYGRDLYELNKRDIKTVINNNLLKLLNSKLLNDKVFNYDYAKAYYELQIKLMIYNSKEQDKQEIINYMSWEHIPENVIKQSLTNLFSSPLDVIELFTTDYNWREFIYQNTMISFFKLFISNNVDEDARSLAIEYLHKSDLLSEKYGLKPYGEYDTRYNKQIDYSKVVLNEKDNEKVEEIIKDINASREKIIKSLYLDKDEASKISKQIKDSIILFANKLGINLSIVRSYNHYKGLKQELGKDLSDLITNIDLFLKIISKTDDGSKLEIKQNQIQVLKENTQSLKKFAIKIIEFLAKNNQKDYSNQKEAINKLNLDTDNLEELQNSYHKIMVEITQIPFTETEKEKIFSDKFDDNYTKLKDKPEMTALINTTPIINNVPLNNGTDLTEDTLENEAKDNSVLIGLITASVICGIAGIIGLGLLVKNKK